MPLPGGPTRKTLSSPFRAAWMSERAGKCHEHDVSFDFSLFSDATAFRAQIVAPAHLWGIERTDWGCRPCPPKLPLRDIAIQSLVQTLDVSPLFDLCHRAVRWQTRLIEARLQSTLVLTALVEPHALRLRHRVKAAPVLAGHVCPAEDAQHRVRVHRSDADLKGEDRT